MSDPVNDLARLREVLGKATPGPWEADELELCGIDPSAKMGVDIGYCHHAYNTQAIAALMNAAPDLLDKAEQLGKLQARCDHKFIDSKCCLKCGWQPKGNGE